MSWQATSDAFNHILGEARYIYDVLTPPPDEPRQRDGLAAIAGVAVVAWTGALVFIAWLGKRPSTVFPNRREKFATRTLSLISSLDLLQTSFIAALVVMLAAPSILRLVAISNLIIYVTKLAREWSKISDPKFTGYKATQIGIDLAILAIVIYPHPVLGTAFAMLTLWLGYQILLLQLRAIFMDEMQYRRRRS